MSAAMCKASAAAQVATITPQCKRSPSRPRHPAQVGFAASFASKLADTTSSEIGKAYGQTTFLVTTLQRVPRGTEGAVSAEGTAAGVVAAAAVAGMAVALGQASAVALCSGSALRSAVRKANARGAVPQFTLSEMQLIPIIRQPAAPNLPPRLPQVDGRGALAVTGAAALANLFESWLGATAQGKVEWLSNDLVNVLQISLAAALAMAFVVWAP